MNLLIKVGTGVLTRDNGQLDAPSLLHLVSEISAMIEAGHRVILVSSGAVGAGVGALGLNEYPKELALKQACAAIGQCRLMRMYEDLFSHFGIQTAQLLLTSNDLKDERVHNVHSALLRLRDFPRVVTVINENDSISVDGLRFGDNDALASRVARVIETDLVVIYSTTSGLYAPGMDRCGSPLDRVVDVEAVLDFASNDKGRFSMGGMASKLQAIARMVRSGVGVFLCHGRHPERARSFIMTGEAKGTYFAPAKTKVTTSADSTEAVEEKGMA